MVGGFDVITLPVYTFYACTNYSPWCSTSVHINQTTDNKTSTVFSTTFFLHETNNYLDIKDGSTKNSQTNDGSTNLPTITENDGSAFKNLPALWHI